MDGEQYVEHSQMICGRVYALIDEILCELERVCEEIPYVDEDDNDSSDISQC